MVIKEITIDKLNDIDKEISLNFQDDLNIITGRNGSGKTTILKLMWYCISGNIERAVREIAFQKVYIKTSEYELTIEISKKDDIRKYVHILLKNENGVLIEQKEPVHRDSAIDKANRMTIERIKESVFFLHSEGLKVAFQ